MVASLSVEESSNVLKIILQFSHFLITTDEREKQINTDYGPQFLSLHFPYKN